MMMMMMRRRILLGVLAFLAVWPGDDVDAHPLAPASLRLDEGAGGLVQARWRVPLVQRPGAQVHPLWPAGCVADAGRALGERAGAAELGWRLQCAGPLAGRVVGVTGLAAAGSDAIIEVRRASGVVVTGLVSAARPTWTIPAEQGPPEVFADYLALGALHLAVGWDHLLFLLGLLLLLPGRSLIRAVTGFTVGHSVTLALAATGVMTAPQALTEVAIAATLVALAVEVASPRGRGSGLVRRWPLGVCAALGWVHGLGFAGVLADAGLPVAQGAAALVGFNVGIEVAQLGLVAVALALALAVTGAIGRDHRWVRAAPVAAAYLIGGLGAYWVLARAIPA